MKWLFSGGLNENPIPSVFEASEGSYNFELSKDSYALRPRKPFDLKATAPNLQPVQGILQLVTRANSVTTLVQAGATVYNWDGASTFSSVGTVTTSSQLRDCYWSLGDYIIVTDIQKATAVKKWDGSSFSTLTTGLAGTLYARYGIEHRGRIWLFNVKEGSTDTPHLLVASEFEDPTSYDTTKRAAVSSSGFVDGNEAFYMVTPDLRPINGVVLFQNQLVISTEAGRLYVLTGSDATDYAWQDFYVGSNAIGTESVVNIGNDVMYMKRGGNIDTLASTQNYGDVAADDVSRFIPNTVSGLTEAIAVYDQQNQKVFFFIGEKILVFFKNVAIDGVPITTAGEKARLSPWSVYKTQIASAFDTAAAKYCRLQGTTDYTVLFGGQAGQIYDLNGAGSGDAGTTAVQVYRTTRLVDEEDGMNFMSSITQGTVQYRRIRPVDLTVEFDYADEYSLTTATIPLKGVPVGDDAIYFGGSNYFGDSIYFSQGFTFTRRISHQSFSVVGKGKGARLGVYAESIYDFQVDNIDLES